jgi:hypothetical protein
MRHSSLDTFTSREYHEGSAAANLLGLQFARIWVMNRQIARARRAYQRVRSPELATLERDGVLVLRDFLPPDTFAAVRREYECARADGLLEAPDCFEDNGVVEQRIRVGKHKDRFPETRRALLGHERMRDLVAQTIGQAPPEVALVISVMMQSDETTAPERLIGSNYIHADIHFPTVKAWLYLNDIDESNGAFRYARGSHRLTPARLAYEYDASVRVARARMRTAVGRDVAYGLVRQPTAQQCARMGIQDEAISSPANTLVVANTMGFHRRGEFQPGLAREMINIRFGDRKSKAAPRRDG